jgi:hypothetical protein
MEVEPLLLSLPQTSQTIGRCIATVYELLGSGQLRGVKSDARTLVTMESIKEYVASLKPVVVAPRPKRKPQQLRALYSSNAAPPRKREPKRRAQASMNT